MNTHGYELHDSELQYHQQEKSELLYNPLFHFHYLGFKNTALHQLHHMKKNRHEEKDRRDCALIRSLVENRKTRTTIIKIRDYFFYFRIKIKKKILDGLVQTLKLLGLYQPVRMMYRKIRRPF